MRRINLRSCLLTLFGLLVIVIVAAIVLYRQFTSEVAIGPLLGDGSETSLQVPPGFDVTVYADGLNNPRFMAFGPDGILHVADRGNGRIVTLPDADGDGQADQIHEYATDLNRPHSLVFHDGAWYVGVPTGVIRLVDTDGDGTADDRQTIVGDIPSSGGHSTRTVIFLPDGRMVLSVGSSCNSCIEEDWRRAAILVYEDATGGEAQLFAPGLRNAVGLAIHPQTGQLWATNNGRDRMGDDIPPETVYIVEEGEDYGWPRCHSGDVLDPGLGQPGDCEGSAQPVVQMQAHSAPLALAFYTGNTFPEEYHGDLFIAFHGSWNRSIPTGYKVVRLPLDGDQPAGPLVDFAGGWLDSEAGSASGRPAGLAVGPDGALYISDDKGGFIYRVTYSGD